MVRPIYPFVALVGVVLMSGVVRSDDPVSSSVTFNREVIRIFQRKCLQCHSSGTVAMSLGTYREARPWSRAIREELVEQRMPPWGAADGYTAIANNAGLTAREMTMILTWLDGGLPKGEERDLPRDAVGPHRPATEPDRRVELPAQRIPADEEYVIRRLIVDSGASGLRRVRRVEIVPGNKRVLRAAFVSMSLPGAPDNTRWIGSWTPWLESVTPPGNSAFVMPAGARLVAELHYRGRDVEMEDRSSIALYFGPENGAAAGGEVADEVSIQLDGARGRSTLTRAARVWAVVPQLPATESSDDASLEVTARAPDGSIQVLLWVPKYRHDWPTPYVLRDPVDLVAGTAITVATRGITSAPAQRSLVRLMTTG
jgi:hypothetical protein